MCVRWRAVKSQVRPCRRRGETNWDTTELLSLVVSLPPGSPYLSTPRDFSTWSPLTESLGHCRRRKIRCLLDSVDPRGRCSNCIRLKKECKFYPVDQQPSLETRARSGSKAEASSNDAETSTSSSPVHQAGSTVVEEIESYHHLQTHPLQPNEDNQGYYPYSASTLSPAGRRTCCSLVREDRTDCLLAPLSALTYEVPHTFDPPSSWEHSPFSSQSSQSLAVERSFPEDASGAFWRPGGSPLTGAYPPSQFSMHSSSLSMTPSSHGSRDGFVPQRARDGRGWHPPQGPVRSMSLVTPEELPAHYQARYFQSPIASGVHASTHYGHASHDTVAGESHSTTERHPTLRQSQTAQQVGFTFPQWGAYQQTDTQTVGSSAQGLPREWYTRSPHLAQVREESGSSHHYQPPTGPSPHERNYG